jgi:hypothetical protein
LGNRYNGSLRQRTFPCIIMKNIEFWIIPIHWIWSYIFIKVSELILIISSSFPWSLLESCNQILKNNLLNSIMFCKTIKLKKLLSITKNNYHLIVWPICYSYMVCLDGERISKRIVLFGLVVENNVRLVISREMWEQCKFLLFWVVKCYLDDNLRTVERIVKIII